MSAGRGKRPLSEEERQLWEKVAQSAEPLEPRRAVKTAPPAVKAAAKPEPPSPVRVPAAKPPKPTTPAPGTIDQRTRTRLSRGSLDVDGRLDLHGLTQSAAHVRLRRFLEDGHAHGARLVLIITGKGGRAAESEFGHGERGVLRRAVPLWLASAEMRHLVAGFDEAGRRHGGSGALYVHIRRKRGAST